MKKIMFTAVMILLTGSAFGACDVKSLKGNYIIEGTYTGYKSGSPTTCGDIGIVVFDGKGSATSVGYESCAGSTYASPISTGLYSIDKLCSGSIVFQDVTVNFVFDSKLINGKVIGASPANLSSGIGTITKQ